MIPRLFALRLHLTLLAVATALSGCPSRPGGRAVDPSEGRSTSDATQTTAAEPDVCQQLQARFGARLKQGGTCARDEDCGCYPEAVDCGGVSDQGTVRQLLTLARMYRLARCPPAKRCSPSACRAVCVQRRCVQSASATLDAATRRPWTVGG